ncbi:MAG: ATP synthase subunit I [Desulforegulaceae bacterium]|nr:ATP synthase subunit I [Desulforegulaceae bacterium]
MTDTSIDKVPQVRIVRFVAVSNWVLLFIFSIASYPLKSIGFTSGIILGGLIVSINFHLLSRTVKKALLPDNLKSHQSVIAKYYIRFSISGVIIFLLLANDIVAPPGLLLGLSVVVASFFLASILEIKKIIFKEAV